MYRRLIILICAIIFAACINGCDNECCSVTPETNNAHIELHPGSVLFTAAQAGPLPPAQDVFLFNSGSSCLGWKASTSDTWIECSPDSGFTGTCGETDTLHIAVDTALLEKGTHTGTVYIQSDDADNNPGSIAVTCSIVSLSDIFVIRDAWWTDAMDADSSGCPESARLTWDADVLDGSTREVSAQVFYRPECSKEWQYYHTTACWTITGEDRDDTYFVTVDNLPAGNYEFSIFLYQCGAPDVVAARDNEDDSDLDNRCFESLVTYSIFDAWWADESDADGDGCRDSGRLAWDADVDEGITSSVQCHVYYRPVGETGWIYYRSTECYDITGKNRDDAYFLSVEGLEPGRYEFIIDLYECGGHGKAAERSYEHDPDLSDQCFDDYVPPPVPTGFIIRDAWWSDEVDGDGDGYFECATLVWDPDVDEGASAEVFSQIYYSAHGTEVWMRYGETEYSTIHGASMADTSSIAVCGSERECYDFTIVLFKSDDHENGVALRNQLYDDDLLNICFELGDQASLPGISPVPGRHAEELPAALLLDRSVKITEGRAPLNPYGGVKEPDAGDSGIDVREGSGSPNPGVN